MMHKLLVEPDPAEIEITPAMVAAGIAAIEPFDLINVCDGYLDIGEVVRKVYRAMAVEACLLLRRT